MAISKFCYVGALLAIVCDYLILLTAFPLDTVKSRKRRRGSGKNLSF